ncbi:MAG TPA: LLM class F420-dependent oxidoreductase [Actinopolymorphaceae bacterium]|jgi:probable F420-dependent oxidoreductase
MPVKLGKYAAWRPGPIDPALAAEVERLGYDTFWIGGSPPGDLANVEAVLDATNTMIVGTSIVNVWTDDAATVARSYHRLEAKHPGRFVLGIGAGHPEAIKEWERPYDKLVSYLDELDREGVPVDRRMVAALGPKVMRLAGERSAGALPYLTTPDHTKRAREILGPDRLLVAEHKVVVETDPVRAREIGRSGIRMYLNLSNYIRNLRRLGWSDADLANDGSDRLVDALALHGDPATIVRGLNAHLEAGADQVGIQVLGPDDPLPAFRALAEVLD